MTSPFQPSPAPGEELAHERSELASPLFKEPTMTTNEDLSGLLAVCEGEQGSSRSQPVSALLGAECRVRSVLLAAADLIEPKGRWTTAQQHHAWHPNCRAWSVLGAITKVSGDYNDRRGFVLAAKALRAFERHIGTDRPAEWERAFVRTQAEVVQALRGAADGALGRQDGQLRDEQISPILSAKGV